MSRRTPDEKFHDHFLKERNQIYQEIEQFMYVVLWHLVDFENGDHLNLSEAVIADRIKGKFRCLMESFCHIHGLYAFPGSSERDFIPQNAVIEIKKHAVKEIFDQLPKIEDKKLVNYCEGAKNEDFWKFNFAEFSLDSLKREPAYIFLEMMRDLLPGSARVSELSRFVLEGLPNENIFRPKVWVQHKEDLKYYGVSLGVPAFVRPLYLFSKLRNLLKGGGENNVKLADVQAYETKETKKKKEEKKKKKDKDSRDDDEDRGGDENYAEYDDVRDFEMKDSGDEENRSGRTANEKRPFEKKSPYSERLLPCKSCKIICDGYNSYIDDTSFNYFGNCAEYDVIRNQQTCSRLKESLKSTYNRKWVEVKSSCENQLTAFRDFTRREDTTRRTRSHTTKEIVKAYYTKAYGTKTLKYKWKGAQNGYILTAKSKAKNESRREDARL